MYSDLSGFSFSFKEQLRDEGKQKVLDFKTFKN